MERASPCWPGPQLLRRPGAPTRESPRQVLSSGMTSPFTSLSSRTTCRCPAAAKVLAAHLHLTKTSGAPISGSHQHTKQPLAETPPGPGPRRLKRTRTDQAAVPLG